MQKKCFELIVFFFILVSLKQFHKLVFVTPIDINLSIPTVNDFSPVIYYMEIKKKFICHRFCHRCHRFCHRSHRFCHRCHRFLSSVSSLLSSVSSLFVIGVIAFVISVIGFCHQCHRFFVIGQITPQHIIEPNFHCVS